MIRDALAMIGWWQYLILAVLAVIVTVPVCVVWERIEDRRDRKAWAKIPGAKP